MAKLKRINPFSTVNNDTGFGTNENRYGGRFINRDGTFNLRREGNPFFERFSIYQIMLNIPIWKFMAIILLFFIVINLVYAGIYMLIGADQFAGFIASSTWRNFEEMYFFSTETFTTVGYGRVNPIGTAANFVASIEALNGFLSFAFATGLIYGRFSRPRANLVFSDHALVSPYRDGNGLMFRFASSKERHALTDVEVQATLALLVLEDGKEEPTYKFYDLALERRRIESLPMNWTVVHHINDSSPLLGLSEDDMRTADVEIYVLIRGFDDVYANVVQQRTSYTFDEIKFGRKFIPMYREDDTTTILELHKLNSTEEISVVELGR